MPAFLASLHLTPLSGTILVVIVVLAGHRFRKAWKERETDSGWKTRAWLFGLVAFVGLLVLAFVPLKG
ncbi:hypothetical protein [Shimia aestuarii]|uniref:hypothetical protein n=1 Tax=Shimia aestuarii TaxID=254406 RepID=UPI001FB39673|nr:hypothetical protein [Shimia aestuarii]